jgi:hypothetical protein
MHITPINMLSPGPAYGTFFHRAFDLVSAARQIQETTMSFGRKLALFVLFGVSIALFSAPANATSTTGTVAVSVTTVASVSLTFVSDASGITLGNSGTSAATIAFGSAQAYGGTVPTGVSKSVNGTTNWTLSTPLDVVVEVANQTSTNYTLTAALQSADGTNTWSVGGTSLTTTPAQLTATGSYGSTPYTFSLTIPFTESAGSITNTISFTATAN